MGTLGCGVAVRVGDERGGPGAAVCMVEFGHRRTRPAERARLERHFGCALEDDPSGTIPEADALIDEARAQLTSYFAGTRREFALPLDTPATAFQRRVWDALLEIPYGQTRSYGQIAAQLGMPGGARAVGMANGANRIAIIVPCHRVIESTGALRGYGGGLERKRYLLELEGGAGGGGTLWDGSALEGAGRTGTSP